MWGRVAGAAVILTCLLPGTAGAAARWYGFNDNSTLSHDLTPVQDARLLAETGANSARLTVDWTWVEPTEGRLDLSMYDPIYNALIASGIRPLLIVTGSPQWAWPPAWEFPACTSGQPCHVPPDPLEDGDWERFVASVAARYPLAAGIEVWNEPNLRGFWATG